MGVTKKVGENVKRIGQTIAVGATGAAMLAMTALPTFAKGAPSWDLTGAYVLELEGTQGATEISTHSMVVAKMELLNGKFKGVGYLTDDNSITWALEGYVDGDNVFFDIVYTGEQQGHTIEFEGTISQRGTMAGTAESSDGKTFEWSTENTVTKVQGIHLKSTANKKAHLMSG